MLGGTSPCADCRDLLAVEGAASRLARDPPAGAEHRAAFGGPREAGTKPGTRTPRWTRRRMRVHPPQRRGREATTMRLYLHAVTAASPPLFRCRQRRTRNELLLPPPPDEEHALYFSPGAHQHHAVAPIWARPRANPDRPTIPVDRPSKLAAPLTRCPRGPPQIYSHASTPAGSA